MKSIIDTIAAIAALLCLALPGLALALEPVRVAPDVYAFPGDNSEISPSGHAANSGFIVGPRAVVVIDTGGSYAHGKAMLAAIATVTPKPVSLVIITHAVQDFVFGAAAFSELGIPLLAHRKTDELMSARCEHCLANLRKALGEAPLLGTRLVLPSELVEGSTRIDAGGRPIELLHFGWASTPGDLAVYEPRSGVLFAGGIVMGARIPELRDGEFNGWLAALAALAELNPSKVIPAYGPVLRAQDMSNTAAYLRDLDAKVKALYTAGRGLMETMDEAGIQRYASWSQYPDLHRRNVLRRYLQLEVEDLER
ncbi:MAG: MBL fold metallo-hydrolase [Burkholderiales bacterium]